MSKKRPTEASWESDEDLLGDGVTAFPKLGDGTEEIDEDALLDSDGEEGQPNRHKGEIIETVDLGLNASDVGFDDTANTQELDYEDIPEESVREDHYDGENGGMEESEEPLMVDDQPNVTTCLVQPTEPVEDVPDDDDSDEGERKKERDRFQTERTTISLASVNYSKASEIPDTLEVTKEMQEEIESFEKQRGKGRMNKSQQRGGQNKRGQNRPQQQQQRFGGPFNSRGSPGQRGGHFGGRQLMSRGRFGGPRNVNPMMPPRGPHNFLGPRGPPPGFGNRHPPPHPQGFNPRPMGPVPVVEGGQPLFQHEMVEHREPLMNQGGPSTQIPQQMMTMPHQPQQFVSPHMDQPHTQYHAPQPDQPHYPQPHHSQPQPLLPHSQPYPLQHPHPQPLLSQPVGSTIHVNPNFQGSLPAHIRPQQQQIPPGSVHQPMFSQPQSVQQFQNPPQNWQPHPAPVQMSFSQSSHANPPSLLGAPSPDRPSLLPSPQMAFSAPGQRYQGLPQQMVQAQQRQPFQPRPQESHFRPQGPPIQQHVQHPNGGPQQLRQPRPSTNQNIRGPRPANQIKGGVRLRGAQQGNIRPQNQQMQPQRMQTPRQPGPSDAGTGWNPPPSALAPQKEAIDPEKLKKQQELEERKRLRAERFKTNALVKVEEGKTVKKIILNPKTPTKRPSGDTSTADELSPPKVIKLEPGGAVDKVKVQPGTDISALALSQVKLEVPKDLSLEKALEEQKRKRELISKAKEAKRQLEAEKRKHQLAKKLVEQAKAKTSAIAVVNHPSSVPQGQQFQQQGHFQGQNQPQQYQQKNSPAQPQQQQQPQQRQFNPIQSNYGNRGQMSLRGQISNRGNRGQLSDRGNKVGNQGQPISVLGQSSPQGQFGRGQNRGGKVRGQLQNRGRGRGVQKFQNVVQLQQVELDSIDYEAADNRLMTESLASSNRTVIPASGNGRQVVGPGMNSMGAASQGSSERIVFEKVETNVPQRRIVVDAKMSSTVLIKDVPKNVNISKIAKRCAQFGQTKVFNYKADEKVIVVQFSKPTEAAAFLNKSFRFMIDMNYYTAVSAPDEAV